MEGIQDCNILQNASDLPETPPFAVTLFWRPLREELTPKHRRDPIGGVTSTTLERHRTSWTSRRRIATIFNRPAVALQRAAIELR